MHFAQVSLCCCCPHVQKQTCTSGSSWEDTEEEPQEVCVLIGSSSSLWLCSVVPGLLGRTACMVPMGLQERGYVGRLQPRLAASTASPGSTVAVAGCAGARSLYCTSLPYSPAFASPPCLSSSNHCFFPLWYLLLSLFPLQAFFFSYPAWSHLPIPLSSYFLSSPPPVYIQSP